MRTVLALLLCLSLAGSALAQDAGTSLDAQLNAVRAEQATADKEAERLDRIYTTPALHCAGSSTGSTTSRCASRSGATCAGIHA